MSIKEKSLQTQDLQGHNIGTPERIRTPNLLIRRLSSTDSEPQQNKVISLYNTEGYSTDDAGTKSIDSKNIHPGIITLIESALAQSNLQPEVVNLILTLLRSKAEE